MKHILAVFAFSAMIGFAFVIPGRPEFHEFFRIAYDQSFSGLEKMKSDKTGKWDFSNGVGDFKKCEIHYDLNKAVHYLKFYMDVEDYKTGIQILDRYVGQLNQILPNTNYRIIPLKKEGASEKAIVYDYKSDDLAEKAKYPTIEADVVENGTSTQMIICLYESFTKTNPATGNK